MMAKRDYTPEEITKVISQIVDEQMTKGYKPGWVRYEMERRAEKAERSGSFYACGCNSYDLAQKAYNVASGQVDIEEVREELENAWEMHQEMVALYG